MESVIRVTFDTNTLDKVARPERFPKDQLQAAFIEIHDALLAGKLKGYFSETLVTLEGIENKNRLSFFGGMQMKTVVSHRTDHAGLAAIDIMMTPEYGQKPLTLHPEHFKRMQAALKTGMRALKAPPRIGWVRIDDVDFYAPDADAKFPDRSDRSMNACAAIELRGLGFAQVESIADEFAKRDNVINEIPLKSLGRARDEHEEGRVKRAIREWADADSVAAHIGYGIDFFCSGDYGKGAGAPSVLDPISRSWLQATYGVKFVDIFELAGIL